MHTTRIPLGCEKIPLLRRSLTPRLKYHGPAVDLRKIPQRVPRTGANKTFSGNRNDQIVPYNTGVDNCLDTRYRWAFGTARLTRPRLITSPLTGAGSPT